MPTRPADSNGAENRQHRPFTGPRPSASTHRYLSAIAPFLLQEELLLELIVGVVLVPRLEELEPADRGGNWWVINKHTQPGGRLW